MGQLNETRILNDLRRVITPASSTRQAVAKTGCWRCGDVIEFYDSPDGICLPATSMGTRTIDCIDPDVAFFFTSTIDLTTASGTVIAVNKTLDDQQAFNNRICSEANPHNTPWIQTHAIASFVENSPIAGQMTVTMTDGTQCYKAGDDYKVLADSGVVISGTIISVNNSQKEVVLDDTADLGAETGEKLANCCGISLEEIIQRFKDSVTGGDDCEDDFDGDCNVTAFELTSEMVSGKSHPSLDGRLLRRGVAGTRASLSDGAANQEIVFTAMTLGLSGDNFSAEIINAAGTAVTISGSFPNMKLSINNNSGAATVNDLIAAIYADAEARKYFQVSSGGGDGTGLASALAETSLAGAAAGAGVYDYAEINDENGDLFWLVFHINANDKNSLKEPFVDSEWLHVDYKC